MNWRALGRYRGALIGAGKGKLTEEKRRYAEGAMEACVRRSRRGGERRLDEEGPRPRPIRDRPDFK